ncbi:MAG: hypothetical protein HOV80_05200 [Polyangiaceae bacterium]|nr:hypothetical protein [Polyangiaceae bacterium]
MSQARSPSGESPESQSPETEAPETDSGASAELEDFLPASSATPAEVALERMQVAKKGPAPLTGLRTGRLVMVERRGVEVLFTGERTPRRAEIESDVDHEVIQEAFENGDRVLCEPDEEGNPVVVGVVRSRKPDTVKILARKVEIEGDEELLLRSGKSALRLREDGDVELVGSRISAASRGLFRLVGRMLRLN